MSARDELIAILRKEGAWCGDCDFESGGCPDCTRILGMYADAILAAGFRPAPRVITTRGELDALSTGSTTPDYPTSRSRRQFGTSAACGR